MRKNAYLIVFFILFALSFSLIRPLNYDEPYYLLCSSFILDNLLPYQDFFFQHMPLMLYIYAPFSGIGIYSLVLGKIISVTFLVASGMILLSFLKRKNYNNCILRAFILLFFLNSFLLDWMTIIRVYAISTFLFVSAVMSFGNYLEEKKSDKFVFITAFLFSILSLSKIVFFANLILYVGYVFWARIKISKDINLSFVISLTIGILLPYIFFIILYWKNLDRFYSFVIEANFLIKSCLQPSTLPNIYKPFLFFVLPQNLILCVIVLFSGFQFNRFEKFVIANCVLYFVMHLFTLLHLEYSISITPFLILLASMRFEKFIHNITSLIKTANLRINLIAVTISIYIFCIPFSLPHLRYLLERKDLLPNVFELNKINNMVNTVNANTVLTSWEGYSIYSNKLTLIRDNYFSNFFCEDINEHQKTFYKIRFPEEYRKSIIAVQPDIVVYDFHDPAHLLGSLEHIMQNYTVSSQHNYITIFIKNK